MTTTNQFYYRYNMSLAITSFQSVRQPMKNGPKCNLIKYQQILHCLKIEKNVMLLALKI